jgi:hypothetical protein
MKRFPLLQFFQSTFLTVVCVHCTPPIEYPSAMDEAAINEGISWMKL